MFSCDTKKASTSSAKPISKICKLGDKKIHYWIGPVMEDLISKGVIIDAWGTNDDTTPFKADYDFYAVTKFPSQELLESFQAIVEGAGWYNYFDQINVSGENIGAEATIGKMIKL